MNYEDVTHTSVSRRSAVKLLAGAGAAVAGSAVLSACGAASPATSSSSTANASSSAKGASTPAAGAGALTVKAATANANWFAVKGTQLAITFRGDDCWGTADTCTFINQKASGAGSWTVQVTQQDNTNAWAKCGLMARSSLDPTSADANVAVTPGNGINLQYREATGDNEGGTNSDNQSIETMANGGVVPAWMKMTTDAAGNWAGWNSADGKTWSNNTVGAQNPVSLGASYLVGLFGCAHDNTQHGTAVFTDIGGFKTMSFSADLVGTNDTVAAPTAPPAI